MFQRLSIAPTQVKAGSIPENLPNKIRQNVVYSLYQAKDITQKLLNSIMNSINL